MSQIFQNFSINLFHFENPNYLYLLIVVFLFAVFEIFPGRKYSFSISKLKRFIDPHLIPHLLQGDETGVKTITKTIYIFVICVLLVLSIANPRWSFEEIESYKANANVVFAIDLSKSMDAEDEKPSRITRVKQEIYDLVEQVPRANLAIIVFAQSAHVISPLTEDKISIKYFTDTLSTELVSEQGSNVKAAIEQANIMFQSASSAMNYMILMSDGDFNTETNMMNYRLSLKNAKLISYGFGTVAGAPIKKQDGSFIKYKDEIVISKYNADTLRGLANEGHYIKSSYLDDDIEFVKKIINEKMKVENTKYQKMKIWHDKFYIPLTLALIMLLPLFRRGTIFPVIFMILCFPNTAHANTDDLDSFDFLKWENIKENFSSLKLFKNEDQKALKHYEDREYEAALEKFSSPYNQAVAAFRAKNFEKSEEFFKEALSKDKSNIKKLYNLGNSQLMQLKAEEAIETYKKALQQDEENEDAKFNLNIARKLLEKQREQQKKNDQNNQNQQKKKDNSDEEKHSQEQQKNGENSDNLKQQKNQDKGKKQNDKNTDSQEGEDEINIDEVQKRSRKQKQSELDKNADEIFNKLSNDTDKFLKNRFKYEEGNNKSKMRSAEKPW